MYVYMYIHTYTYNPDAGELEAVDGAEELDREAAEDARHLHVDRIVMFVSSLLLALLLLTIVLALFECIIIMIFIVIQ